jgi:TPR repeat protein
VIYAEGAGTKSNLVLAVKWWRNAARRDDPKAQYNLGSAYLDGEGVRSNKRLGVSWLQKAANNGHKKAAKQIRALSFVHALK